MRVIAECNSIKSVWALVENGEIVERVTTNGFNPYFQTRREISHTIRLELPESFFKRRWEHVHIYGSGCSTQERKKIVEASAVAQFKTPVTVESNLLGVARGLLGTEAGIACILDTGSNSCQYDGEKIVKQVRSLGFILGDEGSGSSLGRIFVSDYLKGLAPKEISEHFYAKYQISADEILDEVFTSKTANNWLSQYARFLSEHIENEYVNDLVRTELRRFFVRNIFQYEYQSNTVNIVGEVACLFADILREIAAEMGVKIGRIEPYSLDGLVKFHSQTELPEIGV